MKISTRIILTAVLFLAFGSLSFFGNTATPLVSNAAAVHQFDNSDLSYLGAQTGMHLMPWVMSLGGLSLLVALFFLWRPVFRAADKISIPALLLAVLLAPSHSWAYYNQSDYAESYFILPNESAFFVPDVGANKDNQAQFGSLQYYEQSKVAAKRFDIPHQKLPNSGAWSNYYVPTGRLIIVDRTPFNKEWTASSSRGTSTKDESFPCQSSDGLNITLEMAAAASVTEQDASKFLYHFGVNAPRGDRTDPNVIFTSVYYGQSLSQVMDGVGRGQIQTLACAEVSKYTLDDANHHMPDILKSIQDASQKWFQQYGITIDYLGWAGTFTFDAPVQKAINDRFEADKVGPVLGILQARADITVKEGLAQGLATKGLPQMLLAIPTDFINNISSLFTPKATTPTGKP